MKLEEISKRIAEIIQKGNKVLSGGHTSSMGASHTHISSFNEFRSLALSFLKNTFGEDHPYFTDFDKKVINSNSLSFTEIGIGILKAAENEINGGWLFTTRGLISAEIFSDFLEMSEYLLTENYKDAAAVMIGSVLEEHLRQLCIKNSLPIENMQSSKVTPIKADQLNADLTGQGIYSKLDQKNVTAWLDLRNKAAHGKYSEYSKQQVDLMLQGVRDFIIRNAI